MIGIVRAVTSFIATYLQLCDDENFDFIFIGILIGFVINGLLIFGTIKRKQNYLLPWLIIGFIESILFGIVIILFAIGMIFPMTSARRHFSKDTFYKTIMLILLLTAYALSIYIFLAIYSLYGKFKNQHQQLANESTTQDLPRNSPTYTG